MRIVNTFSVQLSTSGNNEKRNSKITPKIPRGLRSLQVAAPTTTDARSEYNALQAEASRIEKWWSESRWKHTKRVYSGNCWFTEWFELMSHMFFWLAFVSQCSTNSDGRCVSPSFCRGSFEQGTSSKFKLFWWAISKALRSFDQTAWGWWLLPYLWGFGSSAGRANGTASFQRLC